MAKSATKKRKYLIQMYSVLLGTHIHQCLYCGDDIDSTDEQLYTIEHIVPTSLFGNSRNSNVRPCCLRCNQDKANMEIHEWYNQLNQAFIETGSDNIQLLRKLLRVLDVCNYVDRMGRELYLSDAEIDAIIKWQSTSSHKYYKLGTSLNLIRHFIGQ